MCDFHREQAWERWIKERKHGMSNEDGLLLLTLLQKYATSPPDFTSHEVDRSIKKLSNFLTEQKFGRK